MVLIIQVSFTVLRECIFFGGNGLRPALLLMIILPQYTGQDGGWNNGLKYYKVPTMAVSVTLKQLEINDHIHNHDF